jgi:hypothetical protein
MDEKRVVSICANPQAPAAFDCQCGASRRLSRWGCCQVISGSRKRELKRLFGEPLDGPSENCRAATGWIVSFEVQQVQVGPPVDRSAPPPETVETNLKEVRISDLAES